MKSPRKKLMMGFSVAVFVFAVSSAAWACTIWVGQFTVTTAQNGDTDRDDPYERVRTWGLGMGMNHCWMEGAIKVHVAGHAGNPNSPSPIEIDYRAIPTSGEPTACQLANHRNPKPGPLHH